MDRHIKMLSVIPVIFVMLFGEVKEVKVYDLDSTTTYQTSEITVRDFLKKAKIELNEKDEINYSLDSYIIDGKEIVIKRSDEVKVIVNGTEKKLRTTEATIRQLFEEYNIEVNEKDKLNYSLDTKLDKNIIIKLDKYEEVIETKEVVIPNDIETVRALYLKEGEKNVIKKGKNGLKEIEIKTTYLGGNKISTKVTNEIIIEKPEKRIEQVGAIKEFIAEDGKKYGYTRIIEDMNTTAYTDSIRDTGKDSSHPQYGITYSGTRTRTGVVAVDPKVIPLHTKLYVEGYGLAVAEDIGSAIKGYKLDLYVHSQTESDNFGRQRRRVYILAE